MIVKSCLSSPAYVEGAVNMRFRPFHYLTEFFPVIDLLELKELYRSACDNHSIIIFILYVAERLVKCQHVLLRSNVRFMCCGLQKLKFHLQWCVTEHTRNLRFSVNLCRHEVEKKYVKRTHILRHSTRIRHYEHVFISKRLYRR